MSAKREDVAERLADDRDARLMCASPSAAVFIKTQALIAALRRSGCRAQLQEETDRPPSEQIHYEHLQQELQPFRRGYEDEKVRCEGRIKFEYDHSVKPFIA
jgi:hypothetical protein